MALASEPAAIRGFVLDALRLSGAVFSEADEELILATCQVTRPGGIFTGPRVVREDLQLVFTPDGAARHPSAELVCPGSFRLQWFITGIRARGFLTKQFYAEDLNTRRTEREILALLPASAPKFFFRNQRRSFVPYLLAIVKLAAVAEEKREELLPLAMNLVDGTYRPTLPERLRRAKLVPELSYQRVERRRVPWREVWRSLQAKALERVASYGAEWYQSALVRLAAEGEQLAYFYREMLRNAEDREAVRAEYLGRLDDLRSKCSPVIRVALINFALLYLPLIVYLVESPDGKPLPPIRYEPAAGVVFWDV